MKPSYLPFYEKHSSFASLRFLWDGVRLKSKVAKQSMLNRQQDYSALAGRNDLRAVHLELHKLVLESQEWSSYDYGEGYFYQGSPSIGIRGLRDTGARLQAMNLNDVLKDLSVLEIGCNTGFLSVEIAKTAKHVRGFDINPYLIKMGTVVCRHLGRDNVTLETTSFEDFQCNEQFDAVLSFANHSTYDQNTKQSISAYLDRCQSLTKPGGLFLFESHPPGLESAEALAPVIEEIGQRFHIEEQRILTGGTFLDKSRTFIRARRECLEGE